MNTMFFHKMLKSIKKKDMMELIIENSQLSELLIKTIPRDHNRIMTSSIKIQASQNIDINNPSGYDNSIIIPSSDFNKMIKDLSIIGSDKISISTSKGYIQFAANADGVVKRDIAFGENEKEPTRNIKNFAFEQVERVAKIASLSTSVHVFPCTDELPLKIKSAIGHIGTMCVYIKSNEMLEMDK